MHPDNFGIRFATEADVPLILALIKELADFEKLSHEVSATEEEIEGTALRPAPICGGPDW